MPLKILFTLAIIYPPKLLYVFDFLGFTTHFLYSPVYPWLPLRKWTAVALILII